MTLGQRIASLRKAKSLTQDQMAESLGVSRQAIAKWEGDVSVPDLENSRRIASLFGISMEELISGEEAKLQEATGETAQSNPQPAKETPLTGEYGAIQKCFSTRRSSPVNILQLIGFILIFIGLMILLFAPLYQVESSTTVVKDQTWSFLSFLTKDDADSKWTFAGLVGLGIGFTGLALGLFLAFFLKASNAAKKVLASASAGENSENDLAWFNRRLNKTRIFLIFSLISSIVSFILVIMGAAAFPPVEEADSTAWGVIGSILMCCFSTCFPLIWLILLPFLKKGKNIF